MKIEGSQYVLGQRREYSLYVLQMRAIPSAADGLKASARRVLWTGKDGKKHKSAVLAGATMPIHPHASPEGTVNTLAAFYGNNIPLLTGHGAFGTILKPTAYGASRYTSVELSQFTKDVIFKDVEIIPMVENYDSTLMEPKHFLPLVPVALLNPTEGIAVGFATDILPRSLEDLIMVQLMHLQGKKVTSPLPNFTPTNNAAVDQNGSRYTFEGEYKQTSASTVVVTRLPYGLLHEKFIDHLDKLCEDGKVVVDYEDSSKDTISVEVKFKRGQVNKLSRSQMMKTLKLVNNKSENLTLVSFDGETVWQPDTAEYIKAFTDWRLEFYVTRYQRLHNLVTEEIQKYLDILLAIEKKVGAIAARILNRSELKEFLETIGIVNLDFIADLPVYRFTEEERDKTRAKLDDARGREADYTKLLNSEEERKKIYADELKEVLKRFNSGDYATNV